MDGGRNRTWMAKTMSAAHNTGKNGGEEARRERGLTFFPGEVKDFGLRERV